jgi:hypothetical protein
MSLGDLFEQEMNRPRGLGDLFESASADPTDIPPINQDPAVSIAAEARRRLGSSMSKEGGEMIGGTVGGVGGAAAGGVVAATLGQIPPFTLIPEESVTVPFLSAFGAYMGGAGGEALHAATSKYKNPPTKQSLHRAGLRQGAYDLGGSYVMSPLIGKMPIVGKLIKKKPGKITPEVKGIGKEFLGAGGTLKPSQVKDSGFGVTLESLAQSNFANKRSYARMAEDNQAVAEQLVGKWVDDIGKPGNKIPREGLGEMLFGEIKRTTGPGSDGVKGRILQQIDDTLTPLYDEVDRLAGSHRVKGEKLVSWKAGDRVGRVMTGKKTPVTKPATEVIGVGPKTEGLKEYAASLLARQQESNGNFLSAEAEKIAKNVMGMGKKMTFRGMRDQSSHWSRLGRKMTEDGDPSDGAIKRLSKLAHEAIVSEGKNPNLSEEARRVLLNANAVKKTTSNSVEYLASRALAKKLYEDPDNVIPLLIPKGRMFGGANSKKIIEMKEFITKTPKGAIDPRGEMIWDRLGQEYLGGVFEESFSGGSLSWKKIRSQRRKMGTKSLRPLIGDKGIDAMKRGESLGKLIDMKGPDGAGFLIHGASRALMISAPVYGALGGDWRGAVGLGAGGVIMASPRAAMRLLQTPTGKGLLVQAVANKPGSRNTGALVVRMARMLEDDERGLNNKAIKEIIKQRAKDAVDRGMPATYDVRPGRKY